MKNNKRVKTRKNWLHSEWFSLAVILVLMTAGRSSLADHYFVPSGSMENSLLPGDRVLVDKTAYGVRIPLTKVDLFAPSPPQRGDIAVFDSPRDGVRLIKRIVAVGGDCVSLRDGRLSINGRELADAMPPDEIADSPLTGVPSVAPTGASTVVERFEGRLALLNLVDGGGPDIHGLVIPDGMVLALGDHRGDSLDGRYFGLVDERELFGRAVRVYYRSGQGFVWHAL
ncbi:MAG: signal peptidase I [Woeseia sp.]